MRLFGHFKMVKMACFDDEKLETGSDWARPEELGFCDAPEVEPKAKRDAFEQ